MTIGEMSKEAGLPASTLRYYEKKGLLRVGRDGGGRRVYSDGDVAWAGFLCRLKETGMALQDIQRYAVLRYRGPETVPQRLAMLRSHRRYVLAQQLKWTQYLQNLDDKIALYEAAIGG